MPRGVHKSESEKAVEQLTKQRDVVSKLQEKQDKLNQVLASLEDLAQQLSTEKVLLAYYEQHPLLQVSDGRDEFSIREDQFEDDLEEPVLPMEIPTWKGFKEAHVKATK